MTCNFLISVGNLSHNWKVLKFVRITVSLSLSLSLSLYCFRIWQFGSGRFAFQVWYLFALIFHLLFVVYSYEQRIHTAIFCMSFYSMATSTPIATRMAIFLYEENFQMSTCFLTDCFLLFIYFLFSTPNPILFQLFLVTSVKCWTGLGYLKRFTNLASST